MSDKPRRNFHLVTVVWGKRFVERFLTTTLPTILAKNNIPVFSSDNEAKYFIHTTKQDEEFLSSSGLIAELKKHLPVNFVTDHTQTEHSKYDRATVMHQDALSHAAANNAATILLPPDGIWSDGTLAKISELSALGYRAVMSDGLRTVREEFMPAFQQEFSISNSGAISVEPRKLLELAISSLHPYEASIMWNSSKIHDVPFRLHWPVKGEGILTRGFCILPILIDPEVDVGNFVGAIDHGLVEAAIIDPKKIYYCKGADEFAVVSIDELGFSGANYKMTGRRERILRIAQWAHREVTPQNLEASNYPFRRNFAPPTEWRWKSVERASQRYLNSIQVCRKLLAVIEAMKNNGAERAANVLAYALNESEITGWLGDLSPQTILAPSDLAIEKIGSNSFDTLLAPEGKNELRQILFNHALSGIKSAQAIEETHNVKVELGEVAVEDWQLHVIDQVLKD